MKALAEMRVLFSAEMDCGKYCLWSGRKRQKGVHGGDYPDGKDGERL